MRLALPGPLGPFLAAAVLFAPCVGCASPSPSNEVEQAAAPEEAAPGAPVTTPASSTSPGASAEARAGSPEAAPGAAATADGADPIEAPDPPPLRTKRHDPADPAGLGKAPPGLGVAAGAPAPDATVTDARSGRPVRLHADVFAPDGSTLLVFYRGGWCPFCNFQLQELIAAQPELARRGVRTAAVSVDRLENAAASQELGQIPFPLLSDPDLAAHEAFRVVHQVGPEEHERLLGFGIDVEQASGRDHKRIAIPSLFLVDAARVVRWAHVDPNYRARPTTAQLLAAIDAALGAPAGRPE